MSDNKKAEDLYKKYIKKRHSISDEEMLKEKKDDSKSQSEKYKDHIDGA